MPQWKNATLLSSSALSSTTRSFIWAIDEKDAASFTPGQFITFDLPIGEKRLERWRSYSIASVPNKEGWVELCIVAFDTGGGSQYLFGLPLGSVLPYKGPIGTFVLPTKLEKPITMICTGTGVAPFKSMLHSLYQRKWPNVEIDLIFGCRTANDILYKDYFVELSTKRERFNYHIATSRESYNSYKGYVHGIYEQLYSGDMARRNYYLCGWQLMVDEASVRLKSLGVPAKQIIYELYG